VWRIVAFIVKNINMIILFACLVGWLDSLPIKIIKKIKARSLKNCLGMNYHMGWHKYQHARANVRARALIRTTILGTLCRTMFLKRLVTITIRVFMCRKNIVFLSDTRNMVFISCLFNLRGNPIRVLVFDKAKSCQF
jgi:hypothetical protein